MSAVDNAGHADQQPVTLEFVADYYRGYPGETVSLWTRLQFEQPVAGSVLIRVWLSAGMVPEPGCMIVQPASASSPLLPEIRWLPQRHDLQAEHAYPQIVWELAAAQLVVGQPYEFRVTAALSLPTPQDRCYDSWAEMVEFDSNGVELRRQQSERVTVQVQAKAQILAYLPGLYQAPEREAEIDYEFLWRYLMYFNRVWDRYDELLSNQAAYFDPRLAPDDFRPWLASWVGLTWDRSLPAALQEQVYPALTLKMLELHRKRGTVAGLQAYLQIWLKVADEEVSEAILIQESVAGNFILDDQLTHLGNDLVLGGEAQKRCHFTVALCRSPEVEQLGEGFIRRLIDAWKPVHTTYDLQILTGLSDNE